MRAPPAIGKFLIGITVPMLFMSSAALADTMRCGSKLIVEGDSSYKTRQLCGEPADIVHTSIMRLPTYVRYGRVRSFGNDLVETSVETWTYNLGPNKLMRRLRFVDDRLESIDTLGYGYNSVRQ